MRFILLASILLCGAAHSQVYKCEGRDGKTYYSQSACPEGGRQMAPRELSGHVGTPITADETPEAAAPKKAASTAKAPVRAASDRATAAAPSKTAAPKTAPANTAAAANPAPAPSNTAPANAAAGSVAARTAAAPAGAASGRVGGPDGDRVTRQMQHWSTVKLVNCDPNGCWDESGRRYPRTNDDGLTPDGRTCTESGGGQYTCR